MRTVQEPRGRETSAHPNPIYSNPMPVIILKCVLKEWDERVWSLGSVKFWEFLK
jgi:hypothetical protein